VAAIIDLCHALQLSVTAEGVETCAQHEILMKLGCDRAQGFLFGRSESPAAIETMLRTPANNPSVLSH
jgi:EAL domain-containing protein (putative c-di-GMP-specific phosphodiesterase class I)